MLTTNSVIIDAIAKHTASIIFLHGLGDTGYGWAPMMRELAPKLPFMKFILPHAPRRPVTLNGGMLMPAWYDIYSLDETEKREDIKGLEESATTIIDLVKSEEASGIPIQRIFIGGFSQGGAVSLFTTLMYPELRVAGVLSLSAYIPCRYRLGEHPPPRPPVSPIFMAHGTEDMIIQLRWHQHTVAYLKGLSARLTVKVYEGMDHSACQEEVHDVGEFVQSQLQTDPDKQQL